MTDERLRVLLRDYRYAAYDVGARGKNHGRGEALEAAKAALVAHIESQPKSGTELFIRGNCVNSVSFLDGDIRVDVYSTYDARVHLDAAFLPAQEETKDACPNVSC